jgi:hypothetical protein
MQIRSDLQTLARACERLLSLELEPELSHDERNFLLYYASELVNKFGKPLNGHNHTHQSADDNLNGLEPTQTERSASPTTPQTP